MGDVVAVAQRRFVVAAGEVDVVVAAAGLDRVVVATARDVLVDVVVLVKGLVVPRGGSSS